jgi:hypothetical protein
MLLHFIAFSFSYQLHVNLKISKRMETNNLERGINHSTEQFGAAVSLLTTVCILEQ